MNKHKQARELIECYNVETAEHELYSYINECEATEKELERLQKFKATFDNYELSKKQGFIAYENWFECEKQIKELQYKIKLYERQSELLSLWANGKVSAIEIDDEMMSIRKQLRSDVGSKETAYSQQDIIDVAKALTPPTAEEVCKTLTDVTGCLVEKTEHHGEIIFRAIPISPYPNKYYNAYDLVVGNSRHIEILDDAIKKPHLITMIGRFYEGLQ